MIGAAANDARAKPAEGGARSRGIGLAFDLPKSVGRQELAVKIVLLSAHADATVGQLVGPDVFFVILFRIERRAGFKQDNIQAAFGKNLGSGAPGSPRANNADVINFWRTDDLGHREAKTSV